MNPAARELFGADQHPDATYHELTEALAPLDVAGQPLDDEALPSRRAMRGELVKGFVMAVHTSRGRVWYSASAAPLWAAGRRDRGGVIVSSARQLAEIIDALVEAG